MSGWFQEFRLNWIAECLRVYGFINREHLATKFYISIPQTSVDFRLFMKKYPELIQYNLQLKRYERKS